MGSTTGFGRWASAARPDAVLEGEAHDQRLGLADVEEQYVLVRQRAGMASGF
jgi:hypothetical protein